MSAPQQFSFLKPSEAAEHAKMREGVAEMLLRDVWEDLTKLSYTEFKETWNLALAKDALGTFSNLTAAGDDWGDFHDRPLDEVLNDILRIRESCEGNRAMMISKSTVQVVENITPKKKRHFSLKHPLGGGGQ